jgi:hypothetical protein
VNRIVDELAACQQAEGNAGLLNSQCRRRPSGGSRATSAPTAARSTHLCPYYGKHIVLPASSTPTPLRKYQGPDVAVTDRLVLRGPKNLSEEQMQQVLVTEHAHGEGWPTCTR